MSPAQTRLFLLQERPRAASPRGRTAELPSGLRNPRSRRDSGAEGAPWGRQGRLPPCGQRPRTAGQALERHQQARAGPAVGRTAGREAVQLRKDTVGSGWAECPSGTASRGQNGGKVNIHSKKLLRILKSSFKHKLEFTRISLYTCHSSLKCFCKNKKAMFAACIPTKRKALCQERGRVRPTRS